jgi:predicted nucleotidyltransferase
MNATPFPQEALKQLFIQHHVLLAYLFGSHARGTAGPLSDIDIAFLFNGQVAEGDRFEAGLQLSRALRNLLQNDKIDLVDLASTDDPLLRYRAVLDGKLLYAEAEKPRFVLEDSVMKEYEDTRYLRAVQAKYLYRHIREGQFGKKSLLAKGADHHVTERPTQSRGRDVNE